MRVLLSTVGTRGDVQPVLALALAVRRLGHEVRLCIPPNFIDQATGMGLEASPVGVEMRAPASGSAPKLTAEQLRRMRESMPDLISDQFDSIEPAAKGCDVILGANAHQYAAPSIAELAGIPFISAVYAPVVLPSPNHAPPPAPGETWRPGPPEDGPTMWREHAQAWNERALERINANRSARGLDTIDDVYSHILGTDPWLAADPFLAPPPEAPGLHVAQTGDWVLQDDSALDPRLESFLDDGEPPVYVGFGSMPVRPELIQWLLDEARDAGRRLVLGRGWAVLDQIDDDPGLFVVDSANHQALFGRVAAVVHHGGAGTTATAARAGVPQVIVPMFSDQFYWASRVDYLGIGTTVSSSQDGPAAMAGAFHGALEPEMTARARDVAIHVAADGADVAALRLVRAA